MSLYIYNSLKRIKQLFEPLEADTVRMYVCGPTVYDYPHIGHAKSYITFDIVVRYLRHLGYRVKYVQNITDVGHLLDSGEDRIMRGARREKVDPMELVERYTRAYFEAMDALNILRPDISPHAAAHVPEQIEMVEKLIAGGYAYEVNGSVYFDVSRWPKYGILSGRDVNDQQAGARVDVNPEKKHPADFALWKKADPEHLMQWNSPWGRGYPGWHIECSVMSMKYLGQTLDIHGGGMENQFPHHECEIAQSEAATGVPFVRYWMHHNMVLVDSVKMSKSLGNFTTVAEALKKHPAMHIRFFVLQTHYRSPVDFSDSVIQSAGQGYQRLLNTYMLLGRLAGSEIAEGAPEDVREMCRSVISAFQDQMDDDFNTPNAIAVIFDFSRQINKYITESEKPEPSSLALLCETYKKMAGDVLGLLPGRLEEERPAKPFIELLIEIRRVLRSEKNWALSDRIRDQLAELGVSVKDSKNGSEWDYQM
ncbi:cysteine--tRNA ligase [candidate division KSB1 bacterium]|nr:cysteine--tRNA ligase [candidate division KSB1 bacterium]